MSAKAIQRKLALLKDMAVVDGSSLEKIYAIILDDSEKLLSQKQAQIDRIIGEITQIKAMKDMLLRALDKYFASEREDDAFKAREKEMMIIKKIEADKRVDQAISEDGLDLEGNISPAPKIEKEEIEIDDNKDPVLPEKIVKPKEKTKARQRRA